MFHIRDPIHGSVELTRVEFDVIETQVFQRLRGIKQLGFTEFAFPGATHSRFAHSIGALDLAGRSTPRVALAEHAARARRRRRVHEPEQPRPAGALKRDLVPADSRALDDHHVQREDAAAVFEKGNREGIQVPEEEGNRDRPKCHRELHSRDTEYLLLPYQVLERETY